MTDRYTRERAERILRVAFQSEADEGDLSHEELLAAAAESGLSREAVENAIHIVSQRERRETMLMAVRRRRRKRFRVHLETYLVVNAMLFGLNFLIGGALWAQWVLLGWGIGVVMNAVKTFVPNPDADERDIKRVERVLERERELLERELRRDRRKARARELKTVFDDGVDVALRLAARRVASVKDSLGTNETPKRARVNIEDASAFESAEDVAAGARRRAKRS